MTTTTTSKIEISLTDFLDFVSKAGNPKLTKVKEVKNRPPYAPQFDFYKPLREGLVKAHQSGGSKKDLQKILDNLTDQNKYQNYADALTGYAKFWGRKNISAMGTLSKKWEVGDLSVSINPELGLKIDGQSYLVKLYFKDERLQKSRVEQILYLMEKELAPTSDEGVKMAVLDVRCGKLYESSSTDPAILALLEGEARSFETIWKTV